MASPRWKKLNILPALLLALCLCACGTEAAGPDPGPVPTQTPPAAPATVRISELMAKNRATIRDEDGDFSDWIELENYGEEDVELTGWRLSDSESREGLRFPYFVLPAGSRALVWASGKDNSIYLHTDFSLSQGERVRLYDGEGTLRGELACLEEEADRSVICTEEGGAVSLYPSPGYPNDHGGYILAQQALEAEGPLVINEVVVSNPGTAYGWIVSDSDWVELKNVSDRPVNLGDYCLSDDKDFYALYPLPQQTLEPGGLFLIRCDEENELIGATPWLPFQLSAAQEKLYLARRDGTLVDFASLRDIPYGCSYGRMEGENGFFYFTQPTPLAENQDGGRYVSRPPELLRPDGVFDGVKEVTVELSAPGEIWYSLDPTVPPLEGERYTGPFTVSETCVIRTAAVEPGGIVSRPRNLSYILNEGHSLPVLSLTADDQFSFDNMYNGGIRDLELSGSLALFDGENGFYADCGVQMHGQTSLVLAKKNLSVHFRPRYGAESVHCDVYGGGVTDFSSFVLRAGQDYYRGVVINALCQNLALEASDALISQRSRFCVLYADGVYMGIYNLMEKPNEAHYAALRGVARDSVTVISSEAHEGDPVYTELFDFAASHDLSVPADYEAFSKLLDIDSLIDWVILEGWSANTDLTYGNLRYVRSDQDDGRWRLIYYDLDAALNHPYNAFRVIVGNPSIRTRQVGVKLIEPLLKNEQFRDRFLTRCGELLAGPLSNESALAELDRLAALVEPEIERDYAEHGMTKEKWEGDLKGFRSLFTGEDPQQDDWQTACCDALTRIFRLSEEEQLRYFGEAGHG